MKITSSDFKNNKEIPKKFSCEGKNINPNLEIEEIPDHAKSLALIINDPDAGGEGFVHWVMWNINPKTTIIKESSVPPGAIQGKNGAEKNNYTGPCPPSGTHHYYLTLYALDSLLKADESWGKRDLEKEMKGHIIDSVEFMGLYTKKAP